MRNAPEVVRKVGVHDFRMATKQQLLHLYGGLLGIAPSAVRGSAVVVRQRFFGMFWPLFLAGSERLRDNRRMTDAAHNQHSETRRPSDRDRFVTTGPSRFQPARPEVLR